MDKEVARFLIVAGGISIAALVLLTVLVVYQPVAPSARITLRMADGGDAAAVATVLEERIEGLGYEGAVKVEGDKFLVDIQALDANELGFAKSVLTQRGALEQRIDGALCAVGDEIGLDADRNGGSYVSGTSWRIYVEMSSEAAARCGIAMEGKAGHMTDIFLDRPKNALLLADSAMCDELQSHFSNHPDDANYSMLSFIESRALTPVVCYASAKPAGNDSILSDIGLSVGSESLPGVSAAVSELARLAGEGRKTVIVSKSVESLPQELQGAIVALNLTAKVYEKTADQPYQEDGNEGSWISQTFGLKSTLSISEGLTYGDPVYQSVFSGGAETNAAAEKAVREYKAWLMSGGLPVELEAI